MALLRIVRAKPKLMAHHVGTPIESPDSPLAIIKFVGNAPFIVHT